LAVMVRRWLIFVIGALHFIISQLYRTCNAVLAPSLIRDLSLDTEGLGLMSAAFFYSFALTQIPLILFIDRFGPRRLMTILSLLAIAGALIFSWSQGLSSALVGRLLLGVGVACSLIGTLKLLSEWFSPLVFASLSGMLFSVGAMGSILSTTPLVLMVEQLGWRMSFQVIAAVHILLTMALYGIVRDRPPAPSPVSRAVDRPEDRNSALRNIGLLLRRKDYWIISAGTFVRYGTQSALQALWAGPLLVEVLGYSLRQAGNIILAMNVGIIVGGPLWGAMSDRIFRTRKWVIVPGLFLLSLTTFLMRQAPPGTGVFLAGAIFFGFGLFASAGLLMYTHIKELVPPAMAGAALTGINFFTMIGSAVFIQGFGGLMQALYPTASRGPAAFKAALLLCVACQVLAALLYLFTKEKKHQLL
jgi:sugar phosphate permease